MNTPVTFHAFRHGLFDITVLSHGSIALAERAARDAMLLGYGHPGVGTVRKEGDSFQFSPVTEARS
ncbi:hypothetical protein HGP16_20070 [Rhizobium sp. P40RR-XXII]|uniref:hypothetical protein n=1 Tax=Rhizobium sp. P40RR-XXII TaxID=2726739 RepID=UPI001457638A|nr:hypothetical protein [Rhizobium sp. P40RR-XXII]NLS18845.1 hypothetical protein [Rhizobium sp. P40RR-XXII]